MRPLPLKPTICPSPPKHMPPVPGHWKQAIVAFIGMAILPTFLLVGQLSGAFNAGILGIAIAVILYAYALILAAFPSQWTPVDTWRLIGGPIDPRGRLWHEYQKVCMENESIHRSTCPDGCTYEWFVQAPVIYNCHDFDGKEFAPLYLRQLDPSTVSITHMCYIPIRMTKEAGVAVEGHFVGALLVQYLGKRVDINWRGTGIFVPGAATFDFDQVAHIRRALSI